MERLSNHTCYSIAPEVFRCLASLCAPKILQKSVLLTAKWDQVAGSSDLECKSGRQEHELAGTRWKQLLEGGAIVARSYGTRDGCMEIVEHVVWKQQTTPNRQEEAETNSDWDDTDSEETDG